MLLFQYFIDIKLIGFFYHFVLAIKKNFKRFNHLTIEEYNIILNDIFNLHFSFTLENVDVLCNKYSETFTESIRYF